MSIGMRTLAFVLLPAALFGYSSNPPLGRTGAPPSNWTCATCHGTLTAGSGVSVTLPSLTYTPGGPAVMLTVNAPGGMGGFEISAETPPTSPTPNAQAGSFTAGANSGVSTSGGIQFAFHTSMSPSFSIQWTPPATNVGNVILYVAGVGTTFGQTYSNTYTLTPAAAPPPNTITAAPSTLTFSSSGAAPAAQSVHVSSSGAPIAFTATAATTTGGAWLKVTPAGANTPLDVSVSADPTGLSAGTYMGTVSIAAASASNSPQTVNVTFNITSAPPPPTPTLTVAPSTLTFNTASGNSQNVHVSASGSGAQSFSAAATTVSGGNWLSVTPISGSTPATAAVSVNLAGLAAGTYNGTVTFTSSGVSNSPQTVAVTLDVPSATPPPPPPPPSGSGPLKFSLNVVDKQSGGSEEILISGQGAVDASGKLTGGGKFTRFTIGTHGKHVTVATGTWKAVSVKSFMPASKGDDEDGVISGGTLILNVDLSPMGGAGQTGVLKIESTGERSGVTLDINGGPSFVPGEIGHVSITSPAPKGGDDEHDQ